MRSTWVIVIMMSWLSGRVVTHICTGVLVSTIEADEVDIPTTRIPTVTSVKGGAIKTVELFALCLKKCGWSWITYYLGRTSAGNGKLLWYYMWHLCLLGNCNLQQQRYLGLIRQGSVAMRSEIWVRKPSRSWRDRMQSGDGRRCSDVIISMALLVEWVHSLMASLISMALLVEHG